MEEDLSSTANIIHEHNLEKLQSSLKNKLVLHPTDTRMFAVSQKRNPYPLLDVSMLKIKSISTGKKTMAHFLLPREPPSSDLF